MKSTILFLILICHCAPLLGSDVKMRVVDDRDIPVTNAYVSISFIHYVQGAGKTYEGRTDSKGEFKATGEATHSVFLVAKQEGHYEARVTDLPKDKNIDFTVVIPRIMKPIPLCASVASVAGFTGHLKLPTQNEWLSFDFEAGDWVAPHGTGKVTDIRLRFRSEFKGYKDHVNLEEEIQFGKRLATNRKQEWSEEKFLERFKITAGKWDAELEISFPGEKEGMHEVAGERFLPYSQMKMPHEAPAEGYVPTWRYTAKSYSPPTTRKDAGFFLRTRVKLDEQGNIKSAHYTKVMGDFYVFAPGGISFTYYFNPTPNDRNLEFDPKKNLFPKGSPGAHIFDP